MSKKDDELKIFRMIYSELQYPDIELIEQPDFKVKMSDLNTYFGVEITELYQDGSSARLQKVNNYINEIIDDKRYRHKDDINELPLLEFAPIIDGKISDNTKIAVEKKNPASINVMQEKLISAINEKTKKANKYDSNLVHIDLIIYDREIVYKYYDQQDLCEHFYNKKIEIALNNSPFREVFLITSLNQNGLVGIQLKAQIFMKKMSLFNKIIYENNHPLLKKTIEEYTQVFCLTLQKNNFRNFCLDNSDSTTLHFAGMAYNFEPSTLALEIRHDNNISFMPKPFSQDNIDSDSINKLSEQLTIEEEKTVIGDLMEYDLNK